MYFNGIATCTVACCRFLCLRRGFHPPSPKKCLEAVGSGQLAREYDPTSNFFKEIPKPTSIDDWLAQYNETGQTYKQFLRECPWLSNRKLKYIKSTFDPSGSSLPQKYPGAKIYLLPLGEFDSVSAPGFSDLAEYAQLFLCLPVEVLPPVKLEVDKDIVHWVDTSESRELGRHEGATRRSIGEQQGTDYIHVLTTNLVNTNSM